MAESGRADRPRLGAKSAQQRPGAARHHLSQNQRRLEAVARPRSARGSGIAAMLCVVVCRSYLLEMSATGDIFYERVLLPHRSLPPAAFHGLMLLLGLVSL